MNGIYYTCIMYTAYFQNVLGTEGVGFKIAMGAFDKTRPPVCYHMFLFLSWYLEFTVQVRPGLFILCDVTISCTDN